MREEQKTGINRLRLKREKRAIERKLRRYVPSRGSGKTAYLGALLNRLKEIEEELEIK